MKKIVLILIILIIPSVLGEEFRPSTVKSIDVNITTQAIGTFSGNITSRDSMEIFYLSIEEDENQEIIFLNEYLEIGGEKILPEKVKRNGLSYASYKLENLIEYANTPEFKVFREARVKRISFIGLGADYNLTSEINSFTSFKEETDYIETNDVELVNKVKSEFQSDSELESIREIVEWVNNNIEYDFDNYYNGIFSARETYDSRAGVCDEFANLTAAFTRIKGIPTKYVSGLSFDGKRFGLHGWLEVYLPNTGWIGVDSTFGEAGYLDATHITFVKTSDANKSIDFIATTKSVNPIKIDAELPLPEVQINSVEFFENLLDVKIEKPELVKPNELFEVKAIIKNISGENAILPLEFVFHKDFEQNNNKRLVHFLKDETKTVSWEIRAPDVDVEKGTYKFGSVLLLPDGNVSETIRVGKEVIIPDRPVRQEIPIQENSEKLESLLNNEYFLWGIGALILIIMGIFFIRK